LRSPFVIAADKSPALFLRPSRALHLTISRQPAKRGDPRQPQRARRMHGDCFSRS